MGDELEQRLLDLQEEFQILQESTAEVERRQEARIADLERALHRLQHSNDGFIMEKLDLQSKLTEKDDEIRYLQVELEAAISDRQRDTTATEAARKTSTTAISYIQNTLQKALWLAENTT